MSFTGTVLSFLGPIQMMELPIVIGAIDDLQKKKWTVEEAAAYLRWMEHVNPDVDEETALRNMGEVRRRVELRLAAEM